MARCFFPQFTIGLRRGRILADTAHFDRRLLEVVRHFLKVFADAGKPCIRVRERDLSAILDDDRVKEMVELGHGTTNGGPAVRKDVVAAAFESSPWGRRSGSPSRRGQTRAAIAP